MINPVTLSSNAVHAKAIDTVDSADLPYSEYIREYVAENRPVVVRNATREWSALRNWTPEFFKTRFGDRKVQVSYEQSMSFSEFIDGVLASTHERPGPYMYRLFIHEHLPEVLADLVPQNPYAFPRRYASPLMLQRWRRPDGYLKLLIGGIGGRFPVMHFDGENAHATVTEIYGDKEFVVYPPGDGQYLYPNPVNPNKSLIVDPRHVDVARFPLQARATQHRSVLGPGDMVFVPSGWWHTARALSPSISVGTNILDRSNWDGFVASVESSRASKSKDRLRRMYWKGLGSIMAACETAQEHFPVVSRLLRFPLHVSPGSSAVTRDPSTRRVRTQAHEF